MKRMRVVLVVAVVVGCSGKQAPEPDEPKVEPGVAADEAPDEAPDKAPSPGLPEGYRTMFALGMMQIDPTSGAVILSDEQRTVFVPIFIGGTESTSISHRLRGEPFVRPLTHDLIDSMLEQLGAELAQVQVDDLRDQIYIGSILVRDGDRIFRLDARPSDAIALATGNAIPIYVSEAVIERAGVPADSPQAEPYEAAVFGRGASSADLVREIDKLADKACACTDEACLQSVQVELLTLAQNAADPLPADQEAIMKSVQRMTECIEKLAQPAP